MIPAIDRYLAALEERHLANLTRSELTRALRALSSCYVERREKLLSGAALETAGKRAAFALYYGPLHFLTVTEIVKALSADRAPVTTLLDLGCGTGAAGAAWALTCERRPAIEGIDRSAWAVDEANWTYGHFGLRGRARRGDIRRVALPKPGTALLLAYAVNELEPDRRGSLLEMIASAGRSGGPILVIEPIARRGKNWWTEWLDRLAPLGVRTDEWRFEAAVPPAIRDWARAAGLNPAALTARSLAVNWPGGAAPRSR